MTVIPLEPHKGRPYVTGKLLIGSNFLSWPVYFLVDTAASRSFISPMDERLMHEFDENGDLDEDVFHRGIKKVETMLGRGPVKALPKRDHLAIVFRDLHGQPVEQELDFLYFADERRYAVPRWLRHMPCTSVNDLWDKVGERLTHSILGFDVLRNFRLEWDPGGPGGSLTNR